MCTIRETEASYLRMKLLFLFLLLEGAAEAANSSSSLGVWRNLSIMCENADVARGNKIRARFFPWPQAVVFLFHVRLHLTRNLACCISWAQPNEGTAKS